MRNSVENSGTYGSVTQEDIYQTSQPTDNWGQPPSSQYAFYVDNMMVMHGQFLSTHLFYLPAPQIIEGVIDPDLKNEFSAWEAVSDDAMKDF